MRGKKQKSHCDLTELRLQIWSKNPTICSLSNAILGFLHFYLSIILFSQLYLLQFLLKHHSLVSLINLKGLLAELSWYKNVKASGHHYLGSLWSMVKQSSASQSTRSGQQTMSRGKRRLAETYKTDFEDPSPSLRKRVRGNKGGGGSRNGGMHDARVGQNDLRLKLMHRRRQREALLEIEERKKERHKTMARSVQSAEQSHRSRVTVGQPSTGANEVLLREAIRSSYASQISGGVRPRSPNRHAKDIGDLSSLRNIPADQHVTTRPAEASRTTRVLENDLLIPAWPKGLTPVTKRSVLAAENLASGLTSANGSMLRRSYPDEPTVTVANLLNSLGLGKYAINFHAEEVDMAALKQMGDRDLKELGIPMGPRKKILLAMLAPAKRPVT